MIAIISCTSGGGLPSTMNSLKLIAFDAEDLAVLSAHVQDAVLKVGDMLYDPKAKRFVAVLNRFDWPEALASGHAPAAGEPGGPASDRRLQSALRLERVLAAKVQGIDLQARSDVLSVLALQFEPCGPEQPDGLVTIIFSGGGAIRLEVECIEAELKDLGPAWRARGRPAHADTAGAPSARAPNGKRSA